MRFRHRTAIIISVLAVFVLGAVGASMLFATPDADPDRDEAMAALVVLNRYFNSQPAPAAATFTPPPTVTPTPVLSQPKRLVPAQTSLTAPTITYTHVNIAGLGVSWDNSSPDATGYKVRYRPEGGHWTIRSYGAGVGGVTFGSQANSVSGEGPRLDPGMVYEIQVQALSADGTSPWAGAVLVVEEFQPDPTPSPRPTRTPTPSILDSYANGCEGREEFRLSRRNPAADIRLVAMFKNPGVPEREPWQAPQLPKFSYGFTLREVEERTLLITVNHNKSWSLRLGEKVSIYQRQFFQVTHGMRIAYVLDSGEVLDLDTQPEAVTHMMFEARDENFIFEVNGQEVAINLDDEDLREIEEFIGGYRYHDDGKWHGSYGVTYYNPQWPTAQLRGVTGGKYFVERPYSEFGGSWVLYPWTACKP